jgi:hypothetical protein
MPIGRPHLVVNTYIVDEDVIQAGNNFNLIMGVQSQGTITAQP